MSTLFITYLLVLSLFSNIHADELKFVSVNFPPYTYETPTGGAGAMYDVVKEIAKRLNQPADIRFIPWSRARYETENNPNLAIIPLARTPERENSYTWIIHILDDPYVLVALKNSKFDITNLVTAKKLTIGVLAGSAAEPLLKKNGFKYIEPASADIQNVKKLKLGRIDAWMVPLSVHGQYKLEGGLGAEDLKIGISLTILHEYLGGSKSLNQETVKKWQNEFNKMKRDGSYAAIMKKYGMAPLQ